VPSEHLGRIFERFYRAAPPGNGEAHSGGLGLAIAQAIAQAHGGSIECHSTPGIGSTFTVVLPVVVPVVMSVELEPKQKLMFT
jgi:signal transduction histidine kinase